MRPPDVGAGKAHRQLVRELARCKHRFRMGTCCFAHAGIERQPRRTGLRSGLICQLQKVCSASGIEVEEEYWGRLQPAGFRLACAWAARFSGRSIGSSHQSDEGGAQTTPVRTPAPTRLSEGLSIACRNQLDPQSRGRMRTQAENCRWCYART